MFFSKINRLMRFDIYSNILLIYKNILKNYNIITKFYIYFDFEKSKNTLSFDKKTILYFFKF